MRDEVKNKKCMYLEVYVSEQVLGELVVGLDRFPILKELGENGR